jgi:hypothetical protein
MDTESKALRVIILVVMTFIATVTKAQGIYTRVSTEFTVAGFRYGGAIGYVARNKFHAGVFYQHSMRAPEGMTAIPGEFIGVETLITLASSEKIYLSGQLRAGIANKMFAVIVPGIRTSVRILPRLEAATAMHWRYNRPAHELSLQFKI